MIFAKSRFFWHILKNWLVQQLRIHITYINPSSEEAPVQLEQALPLFT